MSDTKNNGGPACSRCAQPTTPTNAATEQSGKPKGVQLPADLELRDYFAAAFLQGATGAVVRGEVDDYTADAVAADAYLFADAMLKARER